MDFPPYISALGRLFYPPQDSNPLPSYTFIRLNFECTSGKSLIELYTGSDLGLTFIYQPGGYQDVYLQDLQGRRYLVKLIGTCWLATPFPRIRQQDPFFTLHFKDLPPFKIAPNLVAALRDTTLVFVSELYGNPDLFLWQLIEGRAFLPPQRFTDHPAAEVRPRWSPDRRYLAFTSFREGNNDIYRIDADGQNLINLTRHPSQDDGASWSPNGQTLAFHSDRDGNWEIYLITLDGSQARNLSQHPAADLNPSWSPKGDSIAFQSYRDGNWEIYLLTTDGRNIRRLTQNPEEDIAPAWSPNGDLIAFWSRRASVWGLYLLDPQRGETRLLLSYLNPGPFASPPSWSPDGRYLLFTTLQEGNLELYRIGSDGADLTRLTHNNVNDYDPDW